jgi:hypothetical protein
VGLPSDINIDIKPDVMDFERFGSLIGLEAA